MQGLIDWKAVSPSTPPVEQFYCVNVRFESNGMESFGQSPPHASTIFSLEPQGNQSDPHEQHQSCACLHR